MLSLPLLWLLSLGLSFPTAVLGVADNPPADPQTHSFVWVSDDETALPGQSSHMFLHKLGDDEDDDADDAGAKAGDIQAGGPWLGIQFGPVPKPLASHLKVQSDVGQMVLNVAESSPADTAGLQQFDVITQIDGQDIPAKIGEFLDKVRAFNPNETHTFTILRGGQQTQSTITVGTRPDDLSSTKYKHETAMEDLAEGKVFGRCGMLEKDDQGNWMFKGFNMKDLPDVFHAMPDVGDLDFNFNIAIPGPGGNGHQVFVYKDKGRTLKINREKDGKITVTRTEMDNGKSNTTTTTYDNEDDLKAKDADAYERLKSGPVMIGPGNLPHGMGLFVPHPLDKDSQEWQDLMKNSGEAMKGYEDTLRKMTEQHPGMGFGARKPRTSFEATPDGKIRVTIQQGEYGLVENYDNADALKAARPDLYKKYEKFQRKTAPKDSGR